MLYAGGLLGAVLVLLWLLAGRRGSGSGDRRRAVRPGRAASRAAALVAAVATLVPAGPLVVGAPSAWACSCPSAPGRLAEPLPGDVVLEGRVVDGEDLTSGERGWTVQVDRVFRGRAAVVQPVVSLTDGASCGLELRLGETYLLDATVDRDRPGVLRTGLCSATVPLAEITAAERRDHDRLLGPGRPPDPADSAGGAPPTTDGAGALAVAAVVGLLGVGGGVLWLRRRRAR